MLDDPITRKLESLQSSLRGSLNDLKNKLGKFDRQLDRLDEMSQGMTAYIDEDRVAKRRQFAQTALMAACAEHDRQFGYRRKVRRSAAGMVRAFASGMIGPVFLPSAEQLMIEASDYWLAPAQVALAAWAADNPETARRAVLEALRCDPGRSALFFALLLAWSGRREAAGAWIAEYATAHDGNALTGEFTAVLNVVAQGGLGAPARERLLSACRSWSGQPGQAAEREAEQVASWEKFVRKQRQPLTDTFHPLGANSEGWLAHLGNLEAAGAFSHTEQWLTARLGAPDESDGALPAAVDELLRDLIAAPDRPEGALLETIRRWQVIAGTGDPPSHGQPGEPAPADFRTLCTTITTGTYESKLAAQTVRFCLVFSAAPAAQAIARLSEQARRAYSSAKADHPAIKVEISGWRHPIKPGDDPEALRQEFLAWADQAKREELAELAEKRRRLGRNAARIEQAESFWEANKQEGQQTVYQAVRQVNRFFQRWQQGIAAAGRCIELLQAQDAGAWRNAQDSGPPFGPPRLAPDLPDWELCPPGPAER